MKFCQPHWNELRQAIKANGVWDLVATSGEEAISQLKDELAGVEKTLERYDPLMGAHWMIVSRAIVCGGPYLLTGDYCPLCELVKHSEPGMDKEWIAGAAKAAADRALTLKREKENPMTGPSNSEVYTQRERFVIRYAGVTGQTMYVVEIGEPSEEFGRNVRASNKLSSAKRYTLHEASMELEKVREVHPGAELHTPEDNETRS